MENERLCAAIEPLLRWFEQVRKPLPWRAEPTPYHVWISEIMLQQTRIEAVVPYYERFIAAFPDVFALAKAPEEALLKYWEGLGYYSRVRNLHKAAQVIVNEFNGNLPADAAALRRLPGIGDYTAGAIASLAFFLPEPAVDGNVLRVLARFFADSRDVLEPTTRRDAAEALRAVYPSGERAARLTEGLMELGERVCLPNGEPLCGECPLKDLCLAKARNTAACLPVRRKAKERRAEHRTVLLLCCNGAYALRKREKKGLLAGMWEFPNFDSDEACLEALSQWQAHEITPCGETKHVFSHVEWQMNGFSATVNEPTDGFVWKTRDEIKNELALPTAFRFYRNLL